jgi:hypothetical protein
MLNVDLFCFEKLESSKFGLGKKLVKEGKVGEF